MLSDENKVLIVAGHEGEKCPRCGNPIETGMTFCPHCGVSLKHDDLFVTCPKCGKTYPRGKYQYCYVCGTPLNNLAKTEQQAAPSSRETASLEDGKSDSAAPFVYPVLPFKVKTERAALIILSVFPILIGTYGAYCYKTLVDPSYSGENGITVLLTDALLSAGAAACMVLFLILVSLRKRKESGVLGVAVLLALASLGMTGYGSYIGLKFVAEGIINKTLSYANLTETLNYTAIIACVVSAVFCLILTFMSFACFVNAVKLQKGVKEPAK